MYCQLMLVADMDSYTDQSLHFVGVAQSIGLLMLVWLFGFTQVHAPEEAKLVAAMIVQQVVQQQQNGNEDGSTGNPDEFDAAAAAEAAVDGTVGAAEAAIPVEQSEF
eukprot:CAMPEP_0119016814 /NCGR_PEP_ID=MMETSP1176-20130426/14511_1 /TAXON_ID=265551 /ORGANISM="Synedropsis recta cf, Strain CCMP1620" /LENGTH=106 /DNA_ID=CAMNT_0006970357 /DNA_START=231 /DNA_END=551 /DNA_ORIENTATION=+